MALRLVDKLPLPAESVPTLKTILGGSGVVMSGVISKATIIITHIRGLITPLRTTHAPPSTGSFLYGGPATAAGAQAAVKVLLEDGSS